MSIDHEPLRETFPGIPPFPINVPAVPLIRISLSKLRAGDEAELARLFSASKTLGFFYLDLRTDESGEQILDEADQLFGIGEQLFDLGRVELAKYDYSEQISYFGYKGYGAAYADEKGNLDRNEFYNAGKDDFFGQSPHPLAHPQLLHAHAPFLKSYMHNAHALTTLILTHLTAQLSLRPGTLTSLHSLDLLSGDHVRFIRSPPQPPSDLRTAMGAHTDFGSVTILFNRLGGLQVLSPSDGSSNGSSGGGGAEWQYVKPLPGHCIVNLGDALVKFTNGLLRSNLHRVVAPPGEQARCTRYAVVYFARPGDDVVLKRVEGGEESAIPALEKGLEEAEEGLSSREHIRRKALGKRVGVNVDGVPTYLPGAGGTREEVSVS